MITEDALIRGSAWLAFGLYVLSQIALRLPSRRAQKLAWCLNASGWAALIIHICFAFHFRYGWSETAAYEDTARQTAAFAGWDSGTGLYVNYAFALVWLLALARVRPAAAPDVPCKLSSGERMFRGFILFMFFNAAFVFVRGPARWLGLIGCSVLLLAWFVRSAPNAQGVS